MRSFGHSAKDLVTAERPFHSKAVTAERPFQPLDQYSFIAYYCVKRTLEPIFTYLCNCKSQKSLSVDVAFIIIHPAQLWGLIV